HLLDELHVFIAPLIIGDGRHAFERQSIETLEQAWRLHLRAVLRSGPDIHIIALKEGPLSYSYGGGENSSTEPGNA
ncbi:MAG: dihydrofolate reductase family protein, partial [Bacteroidota bacterium]|nr:dihydrofolate reductase family protein [Bacteroidota bacterium]